MSRPKHKPDQCPIHGLNYKRATCRSCNNAYMRRFLRRRRLEHPAIGLLERARSRARRGNHQFDLDRNDIFVPTICPAVAIPITVGEERAPGSPSLDRVDPELGYVRGNVRVVSDRANRLKGKRSLATLERLAASGPDQSRSEYALVAKYVARELLLKEVRLRAEQGGHLGAEWAKIAEFLDRIFRRG